MVRYLLGLALIWGAVVSVSAQSPESAETPGPAAATESAQSLSPGRPAGPTARLANAKLVKVLSGNDALRRAQAITMLRHNPANAEGLLEPLINLAKTQAEQRIANHFSQGEIRRRYCFEA